MDSNTYSVKGPPGRGDGLDALAADVDLLAAQDLDRLSDLVRVAPGAGVAVAAGPAGGQRLKELAGVDARGAAGAEEGFQVGSTASWLRARLRWGRGRRPAPCGRLGRCSGDR